MPRAGVANQVKDKVAAARKDIDTKLRNVEAAVGSSMERGLSPEHLRTRLHELLARRRRRVQTHTEAGSAVA